MQVNLVISSSGTATAGAATTLTDSALATTYADDYYNDLILEITGGTGKGETALVTDYTGATGIFTFSALSGGSTPDTTSTYEIGSRYKMPDDFGGTPDGPIRYMRDSYRGVQIDWVHESSIRAMRENTSYTGYPRSAAIRPYGVRQFELIVYPDSVTTDVIEFPYTLYYDDLRLETGVATGGTATTLIDTVNRLEVDDAFKDWLLTITSGVGLDETATITSSTVADTTLTFTGKLSGETTPTTTSVYMLEPPGNNLHPAGFRFDDVILTACLARAEMEIEDLAAGWTALYKGEKLIEAKQLDARSAPRKLGYFGNGRPSRIERTWADVTYD